MVRGVLLTSRDGGIIRSSCGDSASNWGRLKLCWKNIRLSGRALVMAREDVPGQKRLVAYVVPKPGHTFTISGLRGFLKQRLPDYMIPSVFLILDKPAADCQRKVESEGTSGSGRGTTGIGGVLRRAAHTSGGTAGKDLERGYRS